MDGKRQKKWGLFFLHFMSHNPHPLLESILSSPFFVSLIYTHFVSSLLSLLPSSICVLWVGVGEKVRGIFPHVGRPRPNPTPTHFLSLSSKPLCLMSEGSLEENHPYSTIDFLAVCWDVVLLVVPLKSTLCYYSNKKRNLCLSSTRKQCICFWTFNLRNPTSEITPDLLSCYSPGWDRGSETEEDSCADFPWS